MTRFQNLLSIIFIISFCSRSTAETVPDITQDVEKSTSFQNEESLNTICVDDTHMLNVISNPKKADPTFKMYKIPSGKGLTFSGKMPMGYLFLHKYCVYNGFLTVQSASFHDECVIRVFRIIANGKKIFSKNDAFYAPPFVDVNDLPYIPKEPLGFTLMTLSMGTGCDFGATYSVVLENKNKYDIELFCKDSPW